MGGDNSRAKLLEKYLSMAVTTKTLLQHPVLFFLRLKAACGDIKVK